MLLVNMFRIVTAHQRERGCQSLDTWTLFLSCSHMCSWGANGLAYARQPLQHLHTLSVGREKQVNKSTSTQPIVSGLLYSVEPRIYASKTPKKKITVAALPTGLNKLRVAKTNPRIQTKALDTAGGWTVRRVKSWKWFQENNKGKNDFSVFIHHHGKAPWKHDLRTGWTHEHFQHTSRKTFTSSEAADVQSHPRQQELKKQLKKPRMKWKMAAKYGWLTSGRTTATDIVGNTWTRLSVNWS